MPMARHSGLALAPWDVLASSKMRTDAEEEARRKTGEQGRNLFGQGWERNEDQKKMASALEKIAVEVGVRSIQAGQSMFCAHTCSRLTLSQWPLPTSDALCLPNHRWAQGRALACMRTLKRLRLLSRRSILSRLKVSCLSTPVFLITSLCVTEIPPTRCIFLIYFLGPRG